MGLSSEMGAADLAAITGNNGNRGYGMDNDLWILILFFCLFGNGNWGNNGWNGNGNNGGTPYVVADVQRGFDQNAVMNGIGNLQNSVVSGFGDVQLGIAGVNQNICQTGNGIMGAVSNGFSQAEISANARQMADMNQRFGNQIANMQAMNGIQASVIDSGCKTMSGIDNLRYTVATEACADRAAVGDALQAVTAQGVANTNAIMNKIDSDVQSIKDQLYQDKMDAKNDEIANLRQQVAMQNLAASQSVQNSDIVNGIYNRLSQCPVGTMPVYGNQPIFTCPQNQCGCGQNFVG